MQSRLKINENKFVVALSLFIYLRMREWIAYNCQNIKQGMICIVYVSRSSDNTQFSPSNRFIIQILIIIWKENI